MTFQIKWLICLINNLIKTTEKRMEHIILFSLYKLLQLKCYWFLFQCVDNYAYLNRCPSGLYFDDVNKLCTFKSEARCGPVPTSMYTYNQRKALTFVLICVCLSICKIQKPKYVTSEVKVLDVLTCIAKQHPYKVLLNTACFSYQWEKKKVYVTFTDLEKAYDEVKGINAKIRTPG